MKGAFRARCCSRDFQLLTSSDHSHTTVVSIRSAADRIAAPRADALFDCPIDQFVGVWIPRGVAGIIVGMTVNEILAQLESLGDDARRAHNTKAGAPDNQFGVKLGDIRAMAKKIKTDHELALNLWDTGNVEAQLLATLIIKPKSLSADELDKLTRSTTCAGGRLAERLCRRTTSREGSAA